MYYEKINKERLMRYKQYVAELDALYIRKRELLATLGLQSVDFSKTRVTNGNSHRISEEERNAIRLEKINNKIKQIEPIVKSQRIEFDTQIERIAHLDWRYKEILQSYYIDNISAKEIVIALFGVGADKEPEKWKQFYRLQKSALRELQKVSSKPFIELQQQLVFEV